MKRLSLLSSVTAVIAALALQSLSLHAQDGGQDNPRPSRRQGGGGGGGQGGPGGPGGPGGNFDPEQFRQRMMERYREQLGVKDDSEWKLIQTRIEKVSEARREVGFGGFGGGRGGPGGPGGGGGRRGGEASPEREALQKAIDSNASADEIKAKLTAYRTSVKDKEAKLEKAQDDLRKVLSMKQEAAAVLMGLLK